MASTSRRHFRLLTLLGQPAHEIEYRWQVQAPELSHKAKQVYKQGTKGRKAPYDPAVYKEPGGRCVVAVGSPDQLHDARGVAEEAGTSAIVVANGALVCQDPLAAGLLAFGACRLRRP